MPRKCYACDKVAIVACKVNNGTEKINAFLCESCLHDISNEALVEVVASASTSYPVGTV